MSRGPESTRSSTGQAGARDGMDSSRFCFAALLPRHRGSHHEPRGDHMDAKTIAVDLAKDVFEVAFANRADRIVDRQRLTRRQFERLVSTLPAGVTMVMEACGTAHYWGQQCRAQGAEVRLLPCQYVRPYVRRNKTDRTDTEALLEANRCGGITAVPVKTIEQQALQTLHRVRRQWQRARVARINGLRAAFREFGLPVTRGVRAGRRCMATLLADPGGPLPGSVQTALRLVLAEIEGLEQHIRVIDRELARV